MNRRSMQLHYHHIIYIPVYVLQETFEQLAKNTMAYSYHDYFPSSFNWILSSSFFSLKIYNINLPVFVVLKWNPCEMLTVGFIFLLILWNQRNIVQRQWRRRFFKAKISVLFFLSWWMSLIQLLEYVLQQTQEKSFHQKMESTKNR